VFPGPPLGLCEWFPLESWLQMHIRKATRERESIGHLHLTWASAKTPASFSLF
jgi:hypothetical protein